MHSFVFPVKSIPCVSILFARQLRHKRTEKDRFAIWKKFTCLPYHECARCDQMPASKSVYVFQRSHPYITNNLNLWSMHHTATPFHLLVIMKVDLSTEIWTSAYEIWNMNTTTQWTGVVVKGNRDGIVLAHTALHTKHNQGEGLFFTHLGVQARGCCTLTRQMGQCTMSSALNCTLDSENRGVDGAELSSFPLWQLSPPWLLQFMTDVSWECFSSPDLEASSFISCNHSNADAPRLRYEESLGKYTYLHQPLPTWRTLCLLRRMWMSCYHEKNLKIHLPIISAISNNKHGFLPVIPRSSSDLFAPHKRL